MATRSKATSRLILKFTEGDGAEGKAYQRSFNHFNPALTDEQIYQLGSALGALQTAHVASIVRQDTAAIEASSPAA